ncbi:hypothetical protein CONPUDRAFT_96556 [Coniophora puteana RWD-64-598 SS2]|uniref:BTB domain-containing protein n=1 Tax=Coniophora puteana (strain RWD-64-598) TaxID=741705 RepID=A0A5M3N7Z3_CONPW|nr:uncharacterized protein CONPUDRAFT_96556 [Coniophora puteana RWD-64-598 SS2]EIW87224.1 hypothetical protein CONPUDRAFT_96556 [Coniophora puteana RWD-64-598 SS2]
MSDTDARLKRDKSLYFDDGNVVIAAALTPTKNGLLFRVHKSILAKNSLVFADMFTLPDISPRTEAETNDLYDGVPVVPMYDKPQDVRGLLHFFYDAPSVVLSRYDPETPSKIDGILTLAKKYRITPLWDRLVDHFKADWPQTLTDWDVLESEMAIRQQARLELAEDLPFIDEVFPEPGAAIRLARDLDIQEVLPAAFYHLSRLKITQDRRVEGQSSESNHEDDLIWHRVEGGRTANWSFLSIEDFRCLLSGRENIERYLRTKYPDFSLLCRKEGAKCDVRKVSCSKLELLYHSSDILHDLKDFIPEKGHTEEEICGWCRLRVNDVASAVRMELWYKLSEFFSLPPLPDQ